MKTQDLTLLAGPVPLPNPAQMKAGGWSSPSSFVGLVGWLVDRHWHIGCISAFPKPVSISAPSNEGFAGPRQTIRLEPRNHASCCYELRRTLGPPPPHRLKKTVTCERRGGVRRSPGFKKKKTVPISIRRRLSVCRAVNWVSWHMCKYCLLCNTRRFFLNLFLFKNLPGKKGDEKKNRDPALGRLGSGV